VEDWSAGYGHGKERISSMNKEKSTAFSLENEAPPRFKKTPPPLAPTATQRKLFDGLDCLPGQQDLFGEGGEWRVESEKLKTVNCKL
jgi:hypothetical protein